MSASVFLRRLYSRHNLPLLAAAALLLVSVLLAPVNASRSVYDFQVTFDISQSMEVEDSDLDQATHSRLTVSKAAALALLQELPCGSRIGWSIFAGQRALTLVTPLDVCLHYAGLISSLDQITGQMRWANASRIGKGLHQSMRAANSIGSSTTVVFISDGHDAPPLRQGQRGMPNTDTLDVHGLVVGVGGNIPVRIPKTDADGQTIGYWQADDVVQRSDLSAGRSHEELSQLDEKNLIKLALLAKLDYLRLDSVTALAEAIDRISYSQQKTIALDLRWIPASLALLALFWRFRP